ncbi:NADH oxidase [Streptomyces sp. NPDC088923]|uniref:NADH oxidase n=1 Tax=Streptomyces sp. NPDC088923 TaxID=3365913 RepID=UPI0037FAE33C
MRPTPAEALTIHLWSLSEDVVVEHQEKSGQLALSSRWGVDHVERPGAAVREALRRMELGPVVLANATPEKSELYTAVLPTLSKLSHLVVRTLGLDDLGGPLLSVFPVAAHAPFTLVWLPGHRSVQLPRHVVLTVLDSGIALEAAGSPHRVVLHRPEAALVVALLAWPVTPDTATATLPLPPQITEGVIRYLVAAGMAAPSEARSGSVD